MLLDEARMPVAQPRVRAKDFADHPHQWNTLAPRGDRPGQQHAGIEVEHVGALALERSLRRTYRGGERREKSGYRAYPEPRVGRVEERATRRSDSGWHAQL